MVKRPKPNKNRQRCSGRWTGDCAGHVCRAYNRNDDDLAENARCRLADVYNYSAVPPISKPRGIPDDAPKFQKYRDEEYGDLGDHSYSWLSIEELTGFDYDANVEDRRYTRQEGPNSFNGGATCEPGQGQMTTWREFLGDAFFVDLEKLKAAGAERIVFGFDS